MRKETIYTVNAASNEIMRASRTLLSALNFAADSKMNSSEFYICTSEFNGLKKGDPMSNIVDFIPV